MSDENELNHILNNLDNISKGANKFIKNLLLELTKMKEILHYSREKIFIPDKFFNDFLKPQLEEKKKMTKKEMFNLCEQRRKYDSYNTLNSYLYKLEINGFIESERIKNKKRYMLIQKEK